MKGSSYPQLPKYQNYGQPGETTYLLEDSSSIETAKTPNSVMPHEPSDEVFPSPTNNKPADEFSPGLEANTPPLDRAVLFGEFLCTFLFCYLSVTCTSNSEALAQPFNNAAVVAALAASYMPVSGAHLNPAITIALLVTKRIHWKRAIVFVPIQLLAATTASLFVKFLGFPVEFPGIAATATAKELFRAFSLEFMAMFIITAVVFQTAVASENEGGVGKKIAAIYIGFVVLACAGSFGPAIFNPTRASGPAIIAGSLSHHWVYWVGHILGASLAGLISEHIFIAPAGKRKPLSILSDIGEKTSASGERLKSLGVAGLISYGIMNTLYYGIVFSYMLARVGLSSGVAGLAKAWIVTWSLSQVTKPIRLGLSLLLAPFIEKLLQARRARRRETIEDQSSRRREKH